MNRKELIRLKNWLSADEIDDGEELFDEVDTILELIDFWLDKNTGPVETDPEPAVQNLKWANGWGSETPEIVLICRELEHKVSDIPDKAFGHTHTVRCDKCGYFYRYDSS